MLGVKLARFLKVQLTLVGRHLLEPVETPVAKSAVEPGRLLPQTLANLDGAVSVELGVSRPPLRGPERGAAGFAHKRPWQLGVERSTVGSHQAEAVKRQVAVLALEGRGGKVTLGSSPIAL